MAVVGVCTKVGEAPRFSPSHTMSYVQEENGPGPTLACQTEAEVACCSFLQAGRLPNQGPNGRQLGAAPRMLEVTDCGTAVHHARTCIKLPPPRAQQQQQPQHHHHHHCDHHQPCEQRLGRQDRPAGRAACKWAYSHYFPEQPPTKTATRGPPNDALKLPCNRFQTAWAGCFVRPASQPARKKQSLSGCFDLRYSNLHKIVR